MKQVRLLMKKVAAHSCLAQKPSVRFVIPSCTLCNIFIPAAFCALITARLNCSKKSTANHGARKLTRVGDTTSQPGGLLI